jgi:hypothetical protein
MPTPSPRIICVAPAQFPHNERLLGIIVRLFKDGEINKIRLANQAIAEFEAAETN